MEITAKRDGTTLVASLNGRIEGGSSAAGLHEDLKQAVGPEDQALVLDCADLSYISSAGLRIVAITINEARARGMGLAACAMIPPVKSVFEISGFNQLIDLHDTLDGALAAMRNRKEPA